MAIPAIFRKDISAVVAVPYDLPVIGYGNGVVNTLRIWECGAGRVASIWSPLTRAITRRQMKQENLAETICRGAVSQRQSLCRQGASLKAAVFLHIRQRFSAQWSAIWRMHGTISMSLHEKVCFQMNDTHPTVAVAELMRILLDEYGLGWDEAWAITSKDLCVYQPHHYGGGSGEVAHRPVFQRCCPAFIRLWRKSTAAS